MQVLAEFSQDDPSLCKYIERIESDKSFTVDYVPSKNLLNLLSKVDPLASSEGLNVQQSWKDWFQYGKILKVNWSQRYGGRFQINYT